MAAYKSFLTTYGQAQQAAAVASGAPINLVAVALGDGGGNPTTPSPEDTTLVRELYRAAPNRVYPDPKNPKLYTVEVLVPANVGGFTIREMMVYDAHGGAFVVANVPAMYKPKGDGSEGSYGDTVLRVQFLATNASVITLQIDPNVSIASMQWVTNTITIPFLLPGGTTGQVLKKKSNADGDTKWDDASVAEVLVSVVEEVQELALNQTAVILTKCTTQGLAIYVGRARLRPDEWTADPSDYTKLTLTASYPAGTKADFVQNEPAGWIPTPLVREKNLSDILDAPTARANLGVYSKAEVDQRIPAGAMIFFPVAVAPPGWLKMNGAALSRLTYAALFALIGTTYGVGDGFNTFNIPDTRGEFLRGWDDGRGVDSGRTIGSAQANAFGSHGHTATSNATGSHSHTATTDAAGNHAHNGTTSGVGDHQHISPFGDQNIGYPWGQTGANNLVGSHGGIDGDNNWPFTSPTGAHNHTLSTDTQGNHNHPVTLQSGGTHNHDITVSAAGAAETRPRNIAALGIIKY